MVDQCREFAANVSDTDAIDFVQDFEVDLLEHVSIVDAVHYRMEKIEVTCENNDLDFELYILYYLAVIDDIEERDNFFNKFEQFKNNKLNYI